MDWLWDGASTFGAWLLRNKDVVPLVVSPLLALISAAISYRAVTMGPKIQEQISNKQIEIGNRQIDHQKNVLEFTREQAVAQILSAADQKWIDSLRETLVTLEQCIEQSNIIRSIRRDGHEDYETDKFIECSRMSSRMIGIIRLMKNKEDGLSQEFVSQIMDWLAAGDVDSAIEKSNIVFEEANAVIAAREQRARRRIERLGSQ